MMARKVNTFVKKGKQKKVQEEEQKKKAQVFQAPRVGLPVGVIDKFLKEEAILQVVSSNIKSIQYFSGKLELVVVFNNGGEYLYKSVSNAEAKSFALAKSKGSYHSEHIKWAKPYTRLR